MDLCTALATRRRRCKGPNGTFSRLVVSVSFLLFLSLLPSSCFVKAGVSYSQWPTDFGGPNRNGMPNPTVLSFYCSDLSNLTLTATVNQTSELLQTYNMSQLSFSGDYVHTYSNKTLLSFDAYAIGVIKRGPLATDPFESDHPVILASGDTFDTTRYKIVSEVSTTSLLILNNANIYIDTTTSISPTCSPVHFYDAGASVEYFALAYASGGAVNFELIHDFGAPVRAQHQCGDPGSTVVSFLPSVAGYDLLGLTSSGELCATPDGTTVSQIADFNGTPDPTFEAVWHEGTSSIIFVDSSLGFRRHVLSGGDLSPSALFPASGSKLAVSELWNRLYYFSDPTTLNTLELAAASTNLGLASVTLPGAFVAGPSVGLAVFVTVGTRLLAYDLRYLTPIFDYDTAAAGMGIPSPGGHPIFNPNGSMVYLSLTPPRIQGFLITNCAPADTSDSSSTTPSPTASASISASRSVTPSISTTPSGSVTGSSSVTPSNTASNTASVSLTPSATRTQSNTPSATRTRSNTPSVSRSNSNAPSNTASRSHSGSPVSNTATPSRSPTPTPTPIPDPSSSRIIVFPPTQPPSPSKSKKKDNDHSTRRPTRRPTPTSSVIVVGPKECDSIYEVRCPSGKCERDPRDCTGKVDLGDKIIENEFKFNNETRKKTVRIMVTTKDQVVATVEVPPNTIPSGWTLKIGPSTNDKKLSACDREDDSDESATLHSKSYDLTVEDEKGRRRRLEDLPKDIKLSSFARLKKGADAGELCYGFARNEDRQWSCLSKQNTTSTKEEETVYISSATDHLTSFGVLLAYSGESCHNSAYWIAAIVLLGSACACILLVILAYEFIAPFKAFVGGYRAKQSLRRIERRASEKILLERRISAKNVTLQGNLSMHRPSSIPANVIEALS